MSIKNKTINILKNHKIEADNFSELIKKHIKELKQTFDEDLKNEKIELLQQIACDYQLDLNDLVSKYIKRKRGDTLMEIFDNYNIEQKKKVIEEAQLYNGSIYIKVDYKNNDYYVQLEEGGDILNNFSRKVGHVKNGKYVFNDEYINKLHETHNSDYNPSNILDYENSELFGEYVDYALNNIEK